MELHVEKWNFSQWTIQARRPKGEGPHPVLLLLHGWTGDETSMWAFTSRLPKDHLLLAPRGLYPAPFGGYGWHPPRQGGWAGVKDFLPAVDALADLLFTPLDLSSSVDQRSLLENADLTTVSLLGFSQGAALAFTFALTYPEHVRMLGGLAGFLPEGAEELSASQPLTGIPTFLAHGTRDELVPVQRARQAVEVLQQAGAQVQYCEDDVGHKLSTNCFKALQAFFTQQPGCSG